MDSNVFIEASRRYYAFNFGTKFWDFLVQMAENNILCSVDKVLKEIKEGNVNDPLRQWAENQFARYFLSTENNEVLRHYKEIVNKVDANVNYTDNAKMEFMEEKNADAWVIAFAKYKNLTVVTHESYNPNSKKKVLIPNVCREFNIKYIDTFEMLKGLNFRL
ncbi:MAG: DUF4411 family protein [Leptonema sp. (in: bacteria)]